MIPRAVSILVASLLVVACTKSESTERQRPTNVVLILADDLGWGELGSYGQEKIRTPHLDRLAAEGMRFTQAYAGAPVCAPSRNVLLTGLHTGHCTIRGNLPATNAAGEQVEGQHPIPAAAWTLAEALGSAGYATGAMGKWGLGPVGSSGDPNAQGFERFFGYNCQRVAHSYYPPHLWSDGEMLPLNAKPVPGHARQPEGEVRWEDWAGAAHANPRMVDAALAFVQEHVDEPFFLYLPFLEPHVAMQPPFVITDSYPQEWDDRPYRGQCGYTPYPRPRAGYAAMITDLDRHVGAVLAVLEAADLLDDTLVIFTSDNGTTHTSPNDEVFGIGGVDAAFFNSTGGLRGFKGSVFEGGIRVPLIARWPGHIESGSVNDAVVWSADLFPTLCEVGGVEVPAGLDGISVLPTLRGAPAPAERPPLVWAYPEYGGQVAVRFGDWKLLRRDLMRGNAEPGPWQLYDLAVDPGETKDVASSYEEVVEEGLAILRAQIDPNPLFPLNVPGVHQAAESSR